MLTINGLMSRVLVGRELVAMEERTEVAMASAVDVAVLTLE